MLVTYLPNPQTAWQALETCSNWYSQQKNHI